MKQDAKTRKLDGEIELIFVYLKKLLSPPNAPVKKIGFKRYND